MNKLLSLKQISFGYDKQNRIIKDFSLTVGQGEILGLSGGNGSGKSTLLKIIAGFITDYKGTVVMPEIVRQNLGCVIDGAAVFEDLTVKDNIEMMNRMTNKTGQKRMDEAFVRQMELEQYYKVQASKLSLGNKQKLALCMALNQDVTLALLDEPFNGIDPMGKAKLIRYLKKRVEAGMTIIITSHIRGDLELLCHRILTL